MYSAGSGDGMIRLWRIDGNRLFALQRIPIPTGFVNALEFTPDGTKLIAAIGRTHKHGRWFVEKKAKNSVLVINLATLKQLRLDDNEDDAAEEEGEDGLVNSDYDNDEEDISGNGEDESDDDEEESSGGEENEIDEEAEDEEVEYDGSDIVEEEMESDDNEGEEMMNGQSSDLEDEASSEEQMNGHDSELEEEQESDDSEEEITLKKQANKTSQVSRKKLLSKKRR